MATGGADYDHGDVSSGLSLEQKLEEARNYKLQGNSKYKDKAYKAAISKYHRGKLLTDLFYMSTNPPPPPPQ